MPSAMERSVLAENSDPNRAFRTPPSAASSVKKVKCSSGPLDKKLSRTRVSAPRVPKDSKAGNAGVKNGESSKKKKKKPKHPRPAPREEASSVKERARIRANLSSPKSVGGIEPKECDEARPSLLTDSEERRRKRNIALEEAMECLPDPGEGRVMYLVRTFERLLSMSREDGDGSGAEVEKKRVAKWALPGMMKNQPALPLPPRAEETEISYSPMSSLTDSGSAERHLSSSSGNSGSSANDSWRRSRRNSGGSSRRSWDKKLRVTSQQPFKLRTEQRGKAKEEHFLRKVRELLEEEERMRIPVAHGLPWTTDEPECLMKPPTKEATEPIDLVLHTDVRAGERAEFDTQVAERTIFLQQLRTERERQRRIEEEEEIKRLRRELVPRAQPMPDFARPFLPKRSIGSTESLKPQTGPKEPRFQRRLTRLQTKS